MNIDTVLKARNLLTTISEHGLIQFAALVHAELVRRGTKLPTPPKSPRRGELEDGGTDNGD